MSVDLVYQDQYLSTGRTIELVAPQAVSVSLESVDLGVSLDLVVSGQVAVELAIVESLISLELAMTPIVSGVVLTNPQFTYSNGILTRIDYDGGAYKIFTYTSGLLDRIDFFNGSEVVSKTLNRSNGLLTSITENSAQIVDVLGYTPEDVSMRGFANGYAPLGADSKIPSAYLPSYVDDVQEFASSGEFPTIGETGKIYTTTDTNYVYRWSGSSYIQIVSSPGSTDSIAEGSNNLFHTAARVRTAISASGNLTYDESTGVLTYTAPALANVASSGSYNDLSNKPVIPAAQVNSNWNATSGLAVILNKPTIPTVPTNISAFTNDSGYTNLTAARAGLSASGSLSYNATTGVMSYTQPTYSTVATSGSYADLIDKPVIPEPVISELIGDGYVPNGAGSILTIADDGGGGLVGWGSTALALAYNAEILSTFAAGSTITFQDGSVATVVFFDSYAPTYIDLFWDTPKSGVLFPITLKTSDYTPAVASVDALDNTARIKVTPGFGGDQVQWAFQANGKLRLPVGGDIVSSDGVTSVINNSSPTVLKNYGKLYIVGAPEYTASTFTQVPFDSVSNSGPATVVTGSGASFTPNLSGTYRLCADVKITNSGSFANLLFKINGELPYECTFTVASTTNGAQGSSMVYLSASDVVEVFFRSSATAAFSSKTTSGHCEFSWEYIGP